MDRPSRTNIQRITKRAYDVILPQIDDWWGGPARHLFHSVYVYHFSHTSLVAEEGDRVVGVLFGLVSQTDPDLAYIHAVATAPTKRRTGLGKCLYENFFDIARAKGCREVQALVLPSNWTSLHFHNDLGFRPIREGAVCKDGVWVIANYSGPGHDRVVFIRSV